MWAGISITFDKLHDEIICFEQKRNMRHVMNEIDNIESGKQSNRLQFVNNN